MTKLIFFNKSQIKNHILIWFFILTCLHLIGPIPGSSWSAKILGGAIEDISYVFVFYSISFYIFPFFWDSRRLFLLIFSILLSYCVFVTISYLNYHKIIVYLGGTGFYANNPIFILIRDDALYFSIIGSAGIASFFNRYNVYKFQLHIDKEKSILIKELNFRKSQFNSHITFNFLNYCYSKIHNILPEIAESISLYSDILRYSLQTRPEKKVSLVNEISNIENFVNLQRLLNNEVIVNFENYPQNELDEIFIQSNILIPFLEYVINFSICSNCTLSIKFKLEDEKLHFIIWHNCKLNRNVNDNAGLKNIQQVLDLYYYNNYDLTIEVTEEYCIAKLTITDIKTNFNYKFLNKSSSQTIFKGVNSKNKNDSHRIEEMLGNSNKRNISLYPLTRINTNLFIKHAIAWTLVVTYFSLDCYYNGTWAATIIGPGLLVLGFMFVFYSLYLFVLPKFWELKRYLVYVSVFLILVIYSTNRYVTSFIITPFLGGISSYKNVAIYDFFFKTNLYFFIITVAAAFASFFNRYNFYKYKLQTEREKELIIKELNFLKNPFDSKITFDFLNYCYNKVQKHSQEASNSILLFTNMLRHTLQTKPEEKVALRSEITYIENFINLQKLLSTKVFANFTCQGETENKFILPRILITFVENAFKHGLNTDPQHPILIELVVNNNNLVFTTKNKINHSKKVAGTNTGLENVKQSFELHYPNNYWLKNGTNGDFYEVEVTLVL